mmetsp:Transcript_69615/g.181367  ORF Transcript_69615/g.181367 Transcript_69615/m.181367 type:complete len:272 (-) Transcript_69615:226-1041(-)
MTEARKGNRNKEGGNETDASPGKRGSLCAAGVQTQEDLPTPPRACGRNIKTKEGQPTLSRTPRKRSGERCDAHAAPVAGGVAVLGRAVPVVPLAPSADGDAARLVGGIGLAVILWRVPPLVERLVLPLQPFPLQPGSLPLLLELVEQLLQAPRLTGEPLPRALLLLASFGFLLPVCTRLVLELLLGRPVRRFRPAGCLLRLLHLLLRLGAQGGLLGPLGMLPRRPAGALSVERAHRHQLGDEEEARDLHGPGCVPGRGQGQQGYVVAEHVQ